MTKFMLAAGVAAFAISAPAASKPGGNGGGHGQQHGGGHAQQVRGGGHAQAHGGGHAQQARGGGHAQARMSARAQPNRGHAQVKMGARGNAHAQARHQAPARHAQAEQHNKQVPQAQAQAQQRNRQADQHNRQVREAQARQMQQVRHNQAQRAQATRQAQNDQIRAMRNGNRNNVQRNFAANVGYGVGGCPPGLAKKAVACMPPGQARKLVGARVAEARRVSSWNNFPQRLQSVYRDTPDYYYRYGDGYAYRVNRANDVISSLLPLFGAGYGVGQVFPQTYTTYGLPAAYQPFYPTALGNDYRYANGYVYQVDPYTGMIQNVDPMLGYGYGYGQMMPATYSAYNVPYQYRPLYYDTSEYNYRYAPGAIYQVDPQSSLITGVAALLSPGMTIGQPMPLGYGAYNVPYDYRAQYYDTSNNWYRYANGNIYRVNPATQLVTALVASILT
jgi:hypothetical protein